MSVTVSLQESESKRGRYDQDVSMSGADPAAAGSNHGAVPALVRLVDGPEYSQDPC